MIPTTGKAIILEEDSIDFIPKKVLRYLERTNTEWEYFDMRGSFYPENRIDTFQFFSNLPVGQFIICETVMEDFMFLELMTELLFLLKKKKFVIKIMHDCLTEDLLKFYNETTSSIAPKELRKAYDSETLRTSKAAWKKLLKFKQDINKKFLAVLKAHTIAWVGYHDDILLKNLDDIKNSIKTYS